MRWTVGAALLMTSCTFVLTGAPVGGDDGGAPGPDAPNGGDGGGGPGTDGSTTSGDMSGSCADPCVMSSSSLHHCSGGDVACPLGCALAGGAHCQLFYPSGGGVVPADLAAAGVLPVTIGMSTT